MTSRKQLTFILGPIVVITLVLLIGQLGDQQPQPLSPPWESGRFHVSTRANLLGNPEPHSIWPGMEYTLLTRLSKEQGWKLIYHEPKNFSGLFADLKNNRAHLAAANLSMTPNRLQKFLFTRPITESRVVVLTHAGRRDLNDWQDLDEDTTVLKGSIFAHVLRENGVKKWKTSSKSVVDLLDALEEETISATLLDENVWQVFRPFFPNVDQVFKSREAIPIGWALPVDATGLKLKKRIDRWLAKASQQGLLQRLQKEYLAPNDDYDPAGTFYFRRLAVERLPRYRHIFITVSKLTGLDWRLLAAMAYQESHWNPRARSHTGVRGLMMLTRTTAKELDVENRLDSEASVLGAAQYLQKLIDRFPDRIPYDHRVWFALGAYNIGYRHMENARRLAQRNGADPDDWFQVKPWLARMNELKQARSIDAWPADGQQAARYVSNIQLYYRFLLWDSVRETKRD